MKIGVSACLLGERCRYDGKSKASPGVLEFIRGHKVVPVCPECAGGLTCPRVPCEIRQGKVTGRDGRDYTEPYTKGAALCLEKVRDCDLVILQPKSPSCGASMIHDGTFQGGLVPGQGIFAEMLKEAKIPILEADAF